MRRRSQWPRPGSSAATWICRSSLISSIRQKQAAEASSSKPGGGEGHHDHRHSVKEIAVEHRGLRVAGIVKGAGMIEPNVATMLCFLYTDADFPAQTCTGLPGRAAEGQLQHADCGW